MAEFIFISETGKTFVSNFIELFIKFGLLVLLLTINFTALSMALICNKDNGVGTKIFAACYAFLFGIIYILVNYYSYRINVKKSPCYYEGNVFPF
jgi:hypothetical protein